MKSKAYICIMTLVTVIVMLQCSNPTVKPSAPIVETEIESKPQKVSKQSPYDVQYVMGHFDPKKHEDFVEIPVKYADQKGRYMHKEAFDAFANMWEHAKHDGVRLTIKSAVRNFDYQKGIWERKWTGATQLSDGTNVATDIHDHHDKASKILEYSSMPGTSRHHWGTDIDVNAFNNQYFEKGEGLKVYQWLQTHALDYGYGQPYTAKGAARPNGYNEEKWHWSYLPIARPLTDLAKKDLQDSMITDFKGAATAVALKVKDNYVLGIASDCL